jgi:hypothetical protein
MKFSTRRKYKKNGLRKKTYRKYKKGGRESRKRSPSVPIPNPPSRIPIPRTTTGVRPDPHNDSINRVITTPRNQHPTNNRNVPIQSDDTDRLFEFLP